MDPLQRRETEVLDTLEKIKDFDFVLIGGYAVNTYTLPRFSIDCDIVVKGWNEAKKIGLALKELGYATAETAEKDMPYGGSFERYEKELEDGFKVSVDLLIKGVHDRQTAATFTADWIFENSETRELRGKTITKRISLRIIDLDALFVMKAVSARKTDIRDIFMLAPKVGDPEWVKQGIAAKCDLKERLARILETVNSDQFRDGLQGVYGQVDDKVFEKHSEAISGLSG